MLRVSALRALAMLLGLISVRAHFDDVPILPSVNINLASICQQEKVNNFQNELYTYMFGDLTLNSNVDLTSYSKQINDQKKSLDESLATFNSNFESVQKDIKPFMLSWFKYYAAKHYETYYNMKGGAGLKLKSAEIVKEHPYLKNVQIEVSRASISNLIKLYLNNLNYIEELMEKGEDKNNDKFHQDILDVLADIKSDFHLVMPGIYEVAIKEDNNSLVSLAWFENAADFVGAFTIFKSFLGLPSGTVVFDLDNENEKDGGSGYMNDPLFFEYALTAKGPLRMMILLHNYIADLSFFEISKDDIFYLYILSSTGKARHSPDFLAWLNSKPNDSSEATFLAKRNLFWIYLYFSSGNIDNYLLTDLSLGGVAEVVKRFLLDTSFCYKKGSVKLDPKNILQNDKERRTPVKAAEEYKGKCYLEEFLPPHFYIENWPKMLELVLKITSGSEGEKIDISKDEETIKKLWFFVDLKIEESETSPFLKNILKIQTAVIRNEFFQDLFKKVDIALLDKTEEGDLMYGKTIAKAWKLIEEAILKYANNSGKSSLNEIIHTNSNEDGFVDAIKRELESASNSQARKFFLFRVISNIAIQEIQLISDSLSKGTPKTNPEHEKKMKFLNSVRTLIFNYMKNTLANSVTNDSKDGIKKYFVTSMETQKSASPTYYSTKQANVLRFFDFYFFAFTHQNTNDQNQLINLAKDKKAFFYEIKDDSSYGTIISNDNSFILSLDGFESFKNFVPIFKYFNKGNIIKDEAHTSSSKAFLYFFNLLYKFLAAVRFGRKDLLLNPNKVVIDHCIKCLMIRSNENHADLVKYAENKDDLCPLSYGEQLEVTYGLATFIGKENGAFLDNLIFPRPGAKSSFLKPLTSFKPARLDQFLKMVYYHTDVSSFWEQECSLHLELKPMESKKRLELSLENKRRMEKNPPKNKNELYLLKPICLSVDIIRESMQCGGVQGKNTVGKDLMDDSAALTSASDWIGNCLNEQFGFLRSLKSETIEASSKLYFLAAFSALFELDATNGLFESLLDQAKINGVQSLSSQTSTGEASLAGRMHLNFKTFENKIALISAENDPNLISKQEEELAQFIELRYAQMNLNDEDKIFSTALFSYISNNINNLAAFGDINFAFVEAMVLYGTTSDHRKMAAKALLKTGRTLGLAKIKPNFECSFRLTYKAIVEMYATDRDGFKNRFLKEFDPKDITGRNEASANIDKLLNNETERQVSFISLAIHYVLSSSVTSNTAVQLQASEVEETSGLNEIEQKVVETQSQAKGLVSVHSDDAILTKINRAATYRSQEYISMVQPSQFQQDNTQKLAKKSETVILDSAERALVFHFEESIRKLEENLGKCPVISGKKETIGPNLSNFKNKNPKYSDLKPFFEEYKKLLDKALDCEQKAKSSIISGYNIAEKQKSGFEYKQIGKEFTSTEEVTNSNALLDNPSLDQSGSGRRIILVGYFAYSEEREEDINFSNPFVSGVFKIDPNDSKIIFDPHSPYFSLLKTDFKFPKNIEQSIQLHSTVGGTANNLMGRVITVQHNSLGVSIQSNI